MRKETGFTLIELVMTIVIMGLIVGLSIPFFHTFVSNYGLQGDASTLRGDLNRARSLARANRVNYSLVFVDDQNYEIQDADGNVAVSRQLSRKVRRQSSPNVTFEPVGRVQNPGTIILRKTDHVTGDPQFEIPVSVAGSIGFEKKTTT